MILHQDLQEDMDEIVEFFNSDEWMQLVEDLARFNLQRYEHMKAEMERLAPLMLSPWPPAKPPTNALEAVKARREKTQRNRHQGLGRKFYE